MNTVAVTPSNNPIEDTRRLERATTYVQGLWLPLNPQVLETVRAGLTDGRYELDIQFLLDDLKLDLSLYLLCLRELLSRRDAKQTPATTLRELLTADGVSTLKVFLATPLERLSRHELSSASAIQASQLSESVISAATSEMLAVRVAFDDELAFTAALLRQLGKLLIAWNYPSVYQRAVAAQSQGQSFDATVTELAGFSPTGLIARVTHQWGLPARMRYAVAGEVGVSAEERADIASDDESTAQLDELCRVGECLARANDPARYPEALHDWEYAHAELERFLGVEGLRQIQDRVRLFAQAYQQSFPQIFDRVKELNPEQRIRDYREHSLLSKNPFVQQCPLQLRKRLKDLYAKISANEPMKEQLSFLVKQVVPYAGFGGGVVLTVDSGTTTLVPRLKFGTLSLREAAPVQYVPATKHEDPVLSAFECAQPLLGPPDDNTLAYMAGSLGESQRVGVLYVELPKLLLGDSSSNYMLHFKAVRQAFHDCLRLR